MEPQARFLAPGDLPLKLCNPLVSQAVVPLALALLLSRGAPTQLSTRTRGTGRTVSTHLQRGSAAQKERQVDLSHSPSPSLTERQGFAALPLRPRPLTCGHSLGRAASGDERGSGVPAGPGAGLLCDWGPCGRDWSSGHFPRSLSAVQAR